MIKTLKRKFIALAMVSLALLLTAIVAGLNIINYNKVVSDADARLEVIEENSEWFRNNPRQMLIQPDQNQEGSADPGSNSSLDDRKDFFGPGGKGGPSMTRDEAEESRFFTVLMDSDGNVTEFNTDRISAIDSNEAVDYAEEVYAGGDDNGFVEDFRYSVSETDDGATRVTFLDCGRTLESFWAFLKASVLMSLAGLLVVFIAMVYFAGRIVKPVAESYEKQKRFITDAGHEIKTPLAIIKANLDLLDMELDGAGSVDGAMADEIRDGLKEIDDQVGRLSGLTNDLVYLSRMEEDGHSLVMSEVPLSDIVDDAVMSFVPLARERGKSIEKDIEPMISVQGSTKELEKLVSILMENAIKYSPEPRRIELGELEDGMPVPPSVRAELRKEGRNAVLELRNDVEGEVSNESLSHVFERFYRTDASRNSATGGHGIGLSMASAIVSAHKGRISARTTDGHDFIVTATIPLA
jgi:signal transduction histidine kinase